MCCFLLIRDKLIHEIEGKKASLPSFSYLDGSAETTGKGKKKKKKDSRARQLEDLLPGEIAEVPSFDLLRFKTETEK